MIFGIFHKVFSHLNLRTFPIDTRLGNEETGCFVAMQGGSVCAASLTAVVGWEGKCYSDASQYKLSTGGWSGGCVCGKEKESGSFLGEQSAVERATIVGLTMIDEGKHSGGLLPPELIFSPAGCVCTALDCDPS